MKRLFLIILLASFYGYGQTNNVFHLGHSLVSPYMPSMVQGLADDTPGVTHSYNIGVINGAPLFWHWDNSNTCQGYQASAVDSKVELASGAYEVFVMTEGVPWHTIMPDFLAYADSFQTAALNGNPSIRTFLYETYNCINTGTPTGCPFDDRDTIPWTTRIRDEIVEWEEVADALNNAHPTANPVYIIPVGQAFANLKDSVDAGNVPGISNFFTSFFVDDIHPNDFGFYFTALVHYACIYQTSPVGLTTQTYDEWGGTFNAPSASLALKLQEIAWSTVCEYHRSGVSCSTNSIDELANEKSNLAIYPNPTNDVVRIETDEEILSVSIVDMLNRERKVDVSDDNLVQLGEFNRECLLLRIETPNHTFVKRVVVN